MQVTESAIPDGWTGDPSELITVNKGLTPSASSKEATGGGIYDTLDFRTANAVISQADKFTSSDVVKQFNNIQDARNNIAGIDSNTQNPADHQAIIYYFAKALDPDSVVREVSTKPLRNTLKIFLESIKVRLIMQSMVLDSFHKTLLRT